MLSASTIINKKRLKTQRDKFHNKNPSCIQDDIVAHELDQQILADLPKLEQRVANNETNKYDIFVFIGIKNWLDSVTVTDLASIKQKRKELEDHARIEKTDDGTDTYLLDYHYIRWTSL